MAEFGRPNIPTPRERTNAEKLEKVLVFEDGKYGLVRARWADDRDAKKAVKDLTQSDNKFKEHYQKINEEASFNQLILHLIDKWKQERQQSVFVNIAQSSTKSVRGISVQPRYFIVLRVYSEELCFQAVRNTYRNWCWLEKYTWKEWFDKVRDITYNPNLFFQILSKFNPNEKDADCQVGKYLIGALKNCIFQAIEKEFNFKIMSDWRRLCESSKNKLMQALEDRGYSRDTIARYIFAWEYFKYVYQENKNNHLVRKKGQRWLDPGVKEFQTTASYYESSKQLPSCPNVVSCDQERTWKDIKSWMEESISALKEISRVKENFFYERNYYSDDASRDDTSVQSPQSDSTQLDFYENELRNELLRLNQLFQKKIQEGKQPEYLVKILPIRYGLGLNQTQVSAKFGVKQSTISRYEDEYIQPLLYVLSKVKAQSLGVTVDSAINYIDNWLTYNYKNPDLSELNQFFLSEQINHPYIKKLEKILIYRYQEDKSDIEIARCLKIELTEVPERLQTAKQPLQGVILRVESAKKYLQYCLERYDRTPNSSDDICQVLDEAVRNLDKKQYKVLEDRYWNRLTAQNENLDLNHLANEQTLEKVENQLLPKFIEKITRDINKDTKTWLKHHYKSQIRSLLKESTPEDEQILQLYYGKKLNERKIAECLSGVNALTVDNVFERLSKAETKLARELGNWSQEHLGISLKEQELQQALQNWFKPLIK